MLGVFSILKFLHIVAAITWVGGVITMTLLNARLASTRNSAAMAALSSVGGFLGQRVFGPAAALTLLAGLATALYAGFPMRSLWIIWGFLVILISFGMTATVTRSTTRRLGALAATPNSDAAQTAALQRRLWILTALNILLLLSAVWVMVSKPTLAL
jgi:uncharacterized membrane protein